VSSFASAFFAAAVLGILNAFFRPILILLTLPINLLTLGLFTFVVNALLLMLTSSIISGFHVQGFWSAVFGSLVISVVSWLLTSVVNDEGRIEVIVLRRRGKDRWE
jgi:putative membrane protein